MTRSFEWSDLDQRVVDMTRALTADAVEKVGNGHPGAAISLAPAAYTLFQKVMRHDPKDPNWLGRDRFVLSIGHSSLTLYNQLFLSGYGLELVDLKSLRTWESATPGHPEYGRTPGVEMTTGPLGQGLSSAVGMAMAARKERGLLDPDTPEGESPFDHFIYVIAGDGDIQEGITSEASSLAGVQNLGNLIVIHDDNHITIEGDTDVAFAEDLDARYASYGWHVQAVDWTHGGGEYREDPEALYNAIIAAQKVTDKPSYIRLRTIMAWPLPTKADSSAPHGAALGAAEVRGLKEVLGLDPDATFAVDEKDLAAVRTQAAKRSNDARTQWENSFTAWREENPDRSELLDRLMRKELPDGWTDALPVFEPGKPMATRVASGQVLTALADVLPELWGGSADLGESNNTIMKGQPSFLPAQRNARDWNGGPYGRNIHFGVREHTMGAIVNGIILHGLTRAYAGTFFVFSDYMRGAVRLSAVMSIPSVFVWTHDSVAVGEDGPTHQPIEHLWAHRVMPNLDVVRPADANEVSFAWRGILENQDNPSALILTRQGVEIFDRETEGLASADGVLKGAYVFADTPSTPDVIIIATGSEVAVALKARTLLAGEGVNARVVSAPCLEWFCQQTPEYRESVLPSAVKARVSVEAGTTCGWSAYLGDSGRSVGIDHFGSSADGLFLLKEFGITAENVARAARESMDAVRA